MKAIITILYSDVTPEGVRRRKVPANDLVHLPRKNDILCREEDPNKDFVVVDIRHFMSDSYQEIRIHAVHEPKIPEGYAFETAR